MKTVLFFSCEPGGAEVLVPVIHLLQGQDEYNVVVVSYGQGAPIFEKHGIEYIPGRAYDRNDYTLFERHKPDAIITSASSFPRKDMTERYLWYNAKQLGIPSIAFLDVLQGYELRFCDELDFGKLIYFPDYINCINETGKQELISLGISTDRLKVFGHPFQSEMKLRFRHFDPAPLRKRYGYKQDDKVLLFVSQPIYEYYGDGLGFTQYTVLKYFLEMVCKQKANERIIIKLHPKERKEEFHGLLACYPHLQATIVQNEIPSIDCILIADFVFGMYSTMLTQAYVLDKSVVSFLPGRKVEYFMTKYDYIHCIESFEEGYDYDNHCSYLKNCKPFEYFFDKHEFLEFLKNIAL
ncbi:MAG: hypothetical protein H0Z34_11320 [Brevibacillus sp.]|nr:hypothetical protein [Brevibacillus sp.]